MILLHVIARMLNECERAGVNPRLIDDALLTDAGYVLLIKSKWAVRPRKIK